MQQPRRPIRDACRRTTPVTTATRPVRHIFGAGELAVDRVDYGYALTVHRMQGATVDVGHRYQDGGGRELAYVALSRGRQANWTYVVAEDVDQAAEGPGGRVGSPGPGAVGA